MLATALCCARTPAHPYSPPEAPCVPWTSTDGHHGTLLFPHICPVVSFSLCARSMSMDGRQGFLKDWRFNQNQAAPCGVASYGFQQHEGWNDHLPCVDLRNSLRLAKESNIQYIAFPAISCGVYSYPLKEASKVAISTVKEFSDDFKESTILLLFGFQQQGDSRDTFLASFLLGFNPRIAANLLPSRTQEAAHVLEFLQHDWSILGSTLRKIFQHVTVHGGLERTPSLHQS